MQQKLIHTALNVSGMTCASCELRIESSLRKLYGVTEARADYTRSRVTVTYNSNLISINPIIAAIEKLNYQVNNESSEKEPSESEIQNGKNSVYQLVGIGIILLAFYLIIQNTAGFNFIPQVNQNMGYGILFLVGLMTSFHCIAMCGGINLSQCTSPAVDASSKLSKLRPSFMYNTGRILSYTLIGGIVGTLGSVISFSGAARGSIAILSGFFMVIMGLNMLNMFPWLRRVTPKMPRIFGNRIYNNKGKHGPFYVGLLNGLMPCGPLQAMQIYALGTGSFIAGAFSMFMFSLGTVPLMFGLGALSSVLTGKFSHRMVRVSAVLVLMLGVIMLSRGLSLSGVAYASLSPSGSKADIEGSVQVITSKLDSGTYPALVVQKGIPVKWTITADAESINGCNETLIIPKYGIEKTLVPGDNIIEFTPEQEGSIAYSCWMGMIRSNIKVVSDIDEAAVKDRAPSFYPGNGISRGSGYGCWAAGASVDENISEEDIQAAAIKDGQQEVTIKVNDQGYSPAVVVLQKGIQAKINFEADELNYCNQYVVFPDYDSQLDLNRQASTPWLSPQDDFTFQCGMGMLNGYVKVVNDINQVDREEIIKSIPKNVSVRGGCC